MQWFWHFVTVPMNQEETKWLVSHCSPLLCHCTDNSQLNERFHLSLSEVDCFCVLWSRIPPQSLNAYYAFKKCVLLIFLWVLCFQRLYYGFITGVLLFCGTNWAFYVQYGFWYLWLLYCRVLSVSVIQGTFWYYCVWMERFWRMLNEWGTANHMRCAHWMLRACSVC